MSYLYNSWRLSLIAKEGKRVCCLEMTFFQSEVLVWVCYDRIWASLQLQCNTFAISGSVRNSYPHFSCRGALQLLFLTGVIHGTHRDSCPLTERCLLYLLHTKVSFLGSQCVGSPPHGRCCCSARSQCTWTKECGIAPALCSMGRARARKDDYDAQDKTEVVGWMVGGGS